MWKFYHAFVLNRLVVPTPSSRRHPTHGLVSTQVPTLLVGQTMGMPISLKLIREVLASAGGLTFLMPTPITNDKTRNGEAKDLPAYAQPHGQPWFRVTDWGDGEEVDEVFGPEVWMIVVECEPTSTTRKRTMRPGKDYRSARFSPWRAPASSL